MARRIRWQILTTIVCGTLILVLLGHLALATTASGDPTTGGVYREALVGELRDLNPLRGTLQTPAEADVTALLFEGLTRVEVTGIVAPNLADEWLISPDQRTYTVTLRTDVRWHDGQPFSADDVLWTIGWIQNESFSGDPALAGLWRNIRVNQIDSTTIRFDLPTPFAPFLSQLDLPITPAHILRDADPAAVDAWAARPITTGPYSITERTDTLIRLESVPNYRPGAEGLDPAPLPNLDKLEFSLFPTLNDAHLALRLGDVDALAYNVTENEPFPLPVKHAAVRAPLADYVMLTFNTREPPLTDQPVREALSYAINPTQVISDALDGRALPLLTPILPSSWAYDASLTPYQDDAERSTANRLLDQAGWVRGPDGLRRQNEIGMAFTLLTSNSPERIAVAEAVANQLQTVGISVTVEPIDAQSLAQRLQNHDFSLAIHGWADLGSDPDQYELWHSSQIEAANFSGIQDEVLDDTLRRGREVNDIESRTEIYAQFQRRWLSLAPAIMLYEPLIEQQISPAIQVVGLAPEAAQGEILFQRSDRFRRLANWYQVTTQQLRSDLRRNPNQFGPR